MLKQLVLRGNSQTKFLEPNMSLFEESILQQKLAVTDSIDVCSCSRFSEYRKCFTFYKKIGYEMRCQVMSELPENIVQVCNMLFNLLEYYVLPNKSRFCLLTRSHRKYNKTSIKSTRQLTREIIYQVKNPKQVYKLN